MIHTCPVCGYPQLDAEPDDHTICPCCGVEFGYEDIVRTHSELRQIWLGKGAPWWSQRVPPPPHWSAEAQLRAAKLPVPADSTPRIVQPI